MKGCRALNEIEVKEVLNSLDTTRDKTLFLTGLYSGYRISELLSLKVGDVKQGQRMVDRVTVERCHMKKKQEGRTVLLHPVAKEALKALISEMGDVSPDTYLFKSAKGFNKALTRIGAWMVLRKAFDAAGLTGKTGTHCMRKTFAGRVYDKLGHDLIKTQKALGHKSFASTISYLGFKEEEIDNAILAL